MSQKCVITAETQVSQCVIAVDAQVSQCVIAVDAQVSQSVITVDAQVHDHHLAANKRWTKPFDSAQYWATCDRQWATMSGTILYEQHCSAHANAVHICSTLPLHTTCRIRLKHKSGLLYKIKTKHLCRSTSITHTTLPVCIHLSGAAAYSLHLA